MGRPAIDIAGQRFGYVVVLERYGYANKSARWKCLCDCGNEFVTDGNKLRLGRTRSCGCKRGELIGESHKTHGLSRSRLFRIWKGMRGRCRLDSSDHGGHYKARGITVCKEWMESFESFRDWSFANGYRDDLQIDRIDVNGDYEPSNCRFVDVITNCNNKRNNVILEIDGICMTVANWARETGLHVETIRSRIRAGKTGRDLIKGVWERDESHC